METRFSFYRKPSKFRKVRQIASYNNRPVYGVTIPREIFKQFEGVSLKIEVSGNAILLASGCPYNG